ncbi:hypothetical protein N0V94_009155 [Neodidymelliopsis sp. IMI 364377]|nr:hypothetical protein N0V94_009155 [Neodidymelliopsis sp. IMI 364377]
MVSQHSDRVLLSEMIKTPLDKDLEGAATNDASWKHLAVYEFDDVQKMEEAAYDESNYPSMEGQLKGSRFDVRTYQEIETWQNDEEWNGDPEDVASILVFEWKPRPGREKEAIEFYQTGIGPLFSMAPEILRLRLSRIQTATTLKENSYDKLQEEKLHTYMSLTKMNCEEWPWGEVFAVNDLLQWTEYFEDQKAVKWQASQYVVKRSYSKTQLIDSN